MRNLIALFALLALVTITAVAQTKDTNEAGDSPRRSTSKLARHTGDDSQAKEENKEDEIKTIILAPVQIASTPATATAPETAAQAKITPAATSSRGSMSAMTVSTAVVKKQTYTAQSTQVFTFKNNTDGTFADLSTAAGCSLTRIFLNASNQVVKFDGGGKPNLQPFVAVTVVETNLCSPSLDVYSYGFGQVAAGTLVVDNNLRKATINEVSLPVFTDGTNAQRQLVLRDIVWTDNGDNYRENFNDTFVFGNETIKFHTNGKFQPAGVQGSFSLDTPYTLPIAGSGLIYNIHNGTLAIERN